MTRPLQNSRKHLEDRYNTSTSNTQTSNDGHVDFSDYYNADGSPKWLDNYGFAGEPVDTLLKPGTVIDRFGSDGGTYTSPVGTPYKQRALPYTTNTNNYHKYVVTSTIKVKSGNAAPWFNEQGGEVQYKSDIPISDLIEAGYLKEI